ncbi:flagellin [Exiguobacterium antarcticum]|uniref:flagellin N-terminal helical domain-containing protein n=1 Tax=Exiguobacterium antarcticum TaxID=132920 RepID=UPI000285E820|nr:flagellin [Exiguobacterium antarcticum]AFS71383.1 Flagellin domain protein [Exiguobacterium antarcticum B7]
MIINHNITALNTHNKLSSASAAQGKSMEKLASGLRINKAGDDAAGLAISEKMRSQVRGLDQASRNAQDGISLIQTAEGALNETHDILQRMRELSVQSSNGTNTDADRNEIQKEVNQLTSEVDRIRDTTEFNTKKLLNGDMAVKGSSTTTGIQNVSVTDDTLKAGAYSITAALAADVGLDINVSSSTITGFDATTDVVFAANGDMDKLELGTYKMISTDIGGGNFKLQLQNDSGKVVAENSSVASGAAATLNGSNGEVFKVAAAAVSSAGEATFTMEAKTTAALNLVNASGTVATIASGTTSKNGSFDVGGLKIELNADAFATKAALANVAAFSGTVTNKAETFQIGANESQITKLGIGDMSAKALGIDKLDLTTSAGAQASITKINSAIESVSAERSKLGANQNRLDHTINNLKTSSENLTAAESRVRDVDMAKEMMNQTKNSILAQAAQAMLAQSNQTPQGVLQLLR